MKTKKWLTVLGVALGMAWAQTAQAVYVSSDSLTITITPNAVYALDIDTATASLDLGTLDLDASTFTVRPATVTIGSTFATTDVRVVALMGGVNPWTLSTDSTTSVANVLKAWAVFTDTSVAASPTVGVNGAFDGTTFAAPGSDMLGISAQYAGLAGGATHYVLTPAGTGYKSMDDIPSFASDAPASKAHLWLRFILPPASTVGAKTVTVTLGATAPLP